jgi:formylglycine-generating enzyme required for sulfatase activity
VVAVSYFYFNAGGTQIAQLAPQLAGARTAAQIEDELWDAIKNSEKVGVFEEYIRQYQNGRYLAQAHVKLAGLRDATRPATPATTPAAGQMIKDCAECPDMVALPPGNFQMGGNSYKDWGKPVHDVTISRAFALGKTEVTQGQWMAIMGSNPSGFKDYGDDFPVEKISWHEAKEFLRKLSARTGKTYRLPSEAEWEYACRAGGNHEYCGSQSIEAVAWYTNNAGGAVHAVAGKQPNAFGLYDMSGNALEWVEDCWNDSYNGAPADGSAWKSGDCSNRVLRGGSWNDGQEFVRSAARTIYPSTSRVFGISGLRVARELSERKETELARPAATKQETRTTEPAPPSSQSPDITGIWHWSVRSFLVPDRTNTVNADGTCLLNTGTTCIWTWEEAGKRKVAFRFSDTWTHVMTLAEDGRTMTGKDDWGTAVTAKRAGGK